jgi:AraC-like DNA-binding protein
LEYADFSLSPLKNFLYSEAVKHFDDRRPEFGPYGLTCERWEPQRMRRPDRHNEVELNLLDGGSLTYLMWGQRASVHGGRLAAFWAAVPHQIVEFCSVDSYYVATIPLAWVLSWNLPTGLTHRLLNGEIVQEQERSRAEPDAALLRQWSDDLERGQPSRREIMLLELQARLLRLAEGTAANGPPEDRSAPPAVGSHGITKAEGMARFVAQNYRDPISVADIAGAVELHPDYASTLFKKTFGTTLNRFLLDHRLQHAQRMLVTSDEKMLAVAADAGFNSLSRFNAAFKELCGLTPRQFRKTHQP